MRMIKSLSIVGLMLISSIVQGQKTGYRIAINMQGCQTGNAILAYYYGNKQYIKDSTKVNEQGQFVFSGTEPLAQGIYIAVMPPDNKYIELVVDADQQFELNSEYASPIDKMNVKGSKENTLFYDYRKFLNVEVEKSNPWNKRAQEIQKADSLGYKDNAEFKELRKKIEAIDEEVKDYKNKFIADHPDAFMTEVFLASKDPDIPEPPVLANGRIDSTFAWKYFKDHYWDNIDFSDDRLLRTPVFHNRLERFMTKVILQIPDTVIKEATLLIEKTRKNQELFKYVVFWTTSHFETSRQMGMDAVFVHMAENYYMTGQAFWADSTTVAKIGDRAKKLSYSLIGRTAPNLIMKDTSENIHILHAIQKRYTIIYFWDPECGHCKKVTPVVQEFYHKFKDEFDLEIYAVSTNKERKPWVDYVKEHQLDWINVNDPDQKTAYKYLYDIYSTPVIYLLDRSKKIIAKRLGAEDLENFIRHDMKKGS